MNPSSFHNVRKTLEFILDGNTGYGPYHTGEMIDVLSGHPMLEGEIWEFFGVNGTEFILPSGHFRLLDSPVQCHLLSSVY